MLWSAEFYLSRKKWLLIYKYKSSFWKWTSRQFLLSMYKVGDEANWYSSCCLKHGNSKPKRHNLQNVQFYFCILFRELYKKARLSFRILL